MSHSVDLYNRIYSSFAERVLAAVRCETFGEDIGQNSWLTVEELHTFLEHLQLRPTHHVLDVACGSGGPALLAARAIGCRVTGIDHNEHAIEAAKQARAIAGLNAQVDFQLMDANQHLPFPDASFDAVICIDAINHLANRRAVLREWQRVLKPGGRAVYTDPIVVTGPLTSHEISLRSSIGFFVFVPSGYNESLLIEVGFWLLHRHDATEKVAHVSKKWLEARLRHQAGLVQLEGHERFEGLQAFFATVHCLSSEQRLSRMAYVAEKRADSRWTLSGP